MGPDGKRTSERGVVMMTRSRLGSARWAVAAAGLLLVIGCASDPLPPPMAAVAKPGVPAPAPTPAAPAVEPLPADLGGWDYLAHKLVADGVPQREVATVFTDPRMPAFDGLLFNPYPREPKARYRHFLETASIARARSCHAQNAQALAAAERAHGVPAGVVAAILHVETACGRNTGSSVILHRLARLAMANEPANLERNFERQRAQGPRGAAEAAVRERARYLEDLFYPEVRASFEVAHRLGVDPLAIEGSYGGAFGLPQFLPTSYLRHGADGDGDGVIDLHVEADAIASCARYLAAYGWRDGLTRSERRQVIWHYNRSDAYIDTVLALAEKLDPSLGKVRVAQAALPR
jgi:membrane-bound lytic murein transglycosylase B